MDEYAVMCFVAECMSTSDALSASLVCRAWRLAILHSHAFDVRIDQSQLHDRLRNRGLRLADVFPKITRLRISGLNDSEALATLRGTHSECIKLEHLAATALGGFSGVLKIARLSYLDLQGCSDITESAMKSLVLSGVRIERLSMCNVVVSFSSPTGLLMRC